MQRLTLNKKTDLKPRRLSGFYFDKISIKSLLTSLDELWYSKQCTIVESSAKISHENGGDSAVFNVFAVKNRHCQIMTDGLGKYSCMAEWLSKKYMRSETSIWRKTEFVPLKAEKVHA